MSKIKPKIHWPISFRHMHIETPGKDDHLSISDLIDVFGVRYHGGSFHHASHKPEYRLAPGTLERAAAKREAACPREPQESFNDWLKRASHTGKTND